MAPTQTPITAEEVLVRIDEELRRLQAQRADIEEKMRQVAEAGGGTKRQGDDHAMQDESEQVIANIAKEEAYLEQMKAIVKEFPGAARVMGEMVVKKQHGEVNRGLILTFAQSIVFLIAGWLLSLLAPPTTIFR